MVSMKHERKARFLITISVAVVIACGLVGFYFQDSLKNTVSDIKTNIENQGKPHFVFDKEKFPDWATVGNVYADPHDATNNFQQDKDDLPVSSIIVAQCKAASDCSNLVDRCKPQDNGDSKECQQLTQYTTDGHCFVLAFYNERKIDPDQEVTKYIEHNSTLGGVTAAEAGIKNLTMDTPDGNKGYRLHYYDYESTTAATIQRHGNAIGYVALTNGHIEVSSMCSETHQIDETLSALSSISLVR
jgi:hypothetical protein